jgi:hypothetical protein
LKIRRIKYVPGIVLTVVATLVCAKYLWRSEELPRSQALADGSVLTVESISIGNSNYYQEAFPKAWQLAIGKRLPYTLAARLGWRFDTRGDWTCIANPSGMTSLDIFTKREGPGRGASDQIRVVVLDDLGNSLGWHGGGRSSVISDVKGTHYHEMRSWFIPAFPRRGKTLVVRFLREQGDGKADVPIMQFHITNPQPGPYPIWTPQPWPATRKAGDLTVTLTDFTTGLSASEPTRAAVANEEVVTQLAFDLEAKGRTNCPWQVKYVEISDATGNGWNAIPLGTKTKARPHGVTQTMNLSGNLWPGEPAWKLRVELAPAPGVAPDGKSRLVEFLARPRTLSSKHGTRGSQ